MYKTKKNKKKLFYGRTDGQPKTIVRNLKIIKYIIKFINKYKLETNVNKNQK